MPETFTPRQSVAMILQIALIAVSAGPVLADRGMTPRDIARLDYVGSARMSPDGRHIAYTVVRPRDPYNEPAAYEPEFDDGAPRTELHVWSVEDEESRVYLSDGGFGGVAWKPDGSAISFTAKRGDDKHKCLYELPLTGGEARRILAHETDIGDYTWSPGAKQVAFIASPREDKKKEALAKKGFKAEIYEEELENDALWIADMDKPFDPHRRVSVEGHVHDVAWNPDGRTLLMTVSPSSLIDDIYMASKLRIIDAVSGDVAVKIETAGKLGHAEWSPDGAHVAMIGAEDINDPAEGRLMVTSSDGGAPRDLVPEFEGHIVSFGWRDDRTLMFVAHVGCEAVLGRVGIDGSNIKIIVPPGGPILGSMSLSKPGDRGAFVASAPTHYRELFYMAHGDEKPRRLTTTNAWLDDITFGEQQVIRYAARDGLEIEGVLIRPIHAQSSERAPCIVVVHGGPEAHESNGWLTNYGDPGQVAAARGFAVFYPNYRGSTGRGVAFSKLSQGRYAEGEFDDIVDGIAHLTSLGIIDDKRVGITGGSYGGYASAWGATALTDHFAASVMFVGISEQFSKFGTTDIPNEMHLVHSLTWPWKNPDLYRNSSPILHAEKARTPILIMHGKNDTRVHPTQSMILYRYLKTLGRVPVRLVFYPGEGHGNRKAAARLDYNMRMLRWMEHYLAPGDHRNDAPPAHALDYDLPKKEKSEDSDAAKE